MQFLIAFWGITLASLIFLSQQHSPDAHYWLQDVLLGIWGVICTFSERRSADAMVIWVAATDDWLALLLVVGGGGAAGTGLLCYKTILIHTSHCSSSYKKAVTSYGVSLCVYCHSWSTLKYKQMMHFIWWHRLTQHNLYIHTLLLVTVTYHKQGRSFPATWFGVFT